MVLRVAPHLLAARAPLLQLLRVHQGHLIDAQGSVPGIGFA